MLDKKGVQQGDTKDAILPQSQGDVSQLTIKSRMLNNIFN